MPPPGFGNKAGDYPEHMAGEQAYEKPDCPSYQTEECVTQDSFPTKSKQCAAERLSDRATEPLSDTTLPEYLVAVWEDAIAKPVPTVASRYFLPSMKRLVALCHALQVAAGDGTFYLACRHAAALTGGNYRNVSRCLAKLEKDGLLIRVSTGTVKVRAGQKCKANEYRYGA